MQEAGTGSNLADEGRCKIILLDYFLGEGGEKAVDASIAKATEIYARSEQLGEYPVFVLMSSVTLSAAQVEQFRKKSRLIGGILHYIPKSELKRKDTLERKLMAIAMSLPIAPSMVSLIEAVERALTSARELFSDRMRDLSLEDYAYIDRLSLDEDGQPSAITSYGCSAPSSRSLCSRMRTSGRSVAGLTRLASHPYQRSNSCPPRIWP